MVVESLSCFRRVDYKDFLVSALVALARARAPTTRLRQPDSWAPHAPCVRRSGRRSFRGSATGPRARRRRFGSCSGCRRADAELETGASDPAAVMDEVLADVAVTDPVFLIAVPKSSASRTGAPHSSQSTANADGMGAEQLGQRCRSSPPHCGHAPGSSSSPSRK